MPTANYNPYPSPTGGRGPYGAVPGQIGIPNPYADLSGALGNNALPEANKLVGSDLIAQLGGHVSPGTTNALRIAAAQQYGPGGAGLGPGSQFATDALFNNIAGFSEGQTKQGESAYPNLINTISKTQTVDPALLTDIANRNAMFGAAPDPTAAQNLAQKLFNDYLSSMRGGGGQPAGAPVRSPAGGTVAPPGADTRGTMYGGVQYPTGTAPTQFGGIPGLDFSGTIPGLGFGSGGAGGGGVGLPPGGVEQGTPDTYYNPTTNTGNFDPFFGQGSFYDQGGGLGAGFGASTPAGGTLYTGQNTSASDDYDAFFGF